MHAYGSLKGDTWRREELLRCFWASRQSLIRDLILTKLREDVNLKNINVEYLKL